MEKFLEKRITVKTFLNVILFLIIISGLGYLVMRYNTKEIEKKFAEYKIEAQNNEQQLSCVIDSLNKRYDDLYTNLDDLYVLNWDNVVFWSDYYGIENKGAVLSQIAIESANLTSNICVNHNNLIGMHYPSIRKTTSTSYIRADRKAKVAVYDYWWQSIQDYGYWQDYFGYNKEQNIEVYLAMLDGHGTTGYAEASGYAKAVESIYYKRFESVAPMIMID